MENYNYNYQKYDIQQQLNQFHTHSLKLKINENACTPQQLEYVACFMNNNQHITSLQLKLYEFHFKKNHIILQGFSRLNNLQKLCLTFKMAQIEGDFLTDLIRVLCYQDSLQSISIHLVSSMLEYYSEKDDLMNLFKSFGFLNQVRINMDISFLDKNTFYDTVDSILSCSSIKNAFIQYVEPQINYAGGNEEIPHQQPNRDNEKIVRNLEDYLKITQNNNHTLHNLELQYGYCSLSYKEIKQLSTNFQFFTNLQILKIFLQGNQIENEGLISLSQGLSKCLLIKEFTLYISENKVKDDGLNQLLATLSSFKNIEKLSLDFSENILCDLCFQNVENVFKNCQNLIKFDLNAYYHTTLKGLIFLAKALIFSKNLTNLYLELSKTEISDKFGIELGNSFKNLIELKELRLFFADNKISDVGIKSIAGGINSLNKLEQLSIHLNGNNITKEGSQLLKSSVKNKTKLFNLDQDFMWNDEETNIKDELLVNESMVLKNLELSLQNEQLDKQFIQTVSKCIEQQFQLETLILDTSNIDININTFFELLPVKTHLKQLKRLYISVQFELYSRKTQINSFIKRKCLKLIEFIISTS